MLLDVRTRANENAIMFIYTKAFIVATKIVVKTGGEHTWHNTSFQMAIKVTCHH